MKFTMRSIEVVFADGNTIKTNINGTYEEIREYYIGKSFNFGDKPEHPEDKLIEVVDVKFLD